MNPITPKSLRKLAAVHGATGFDGDVRKALNAAADRIEAMLSLLQTSIGIISASGDRHIDSAYGREVGDFEELIRSFILEDKP